MSEDNLDPYENPAELLQLAARKAANRPFSWPRLWKVTDNKRFYLPRTSRLYGLETRRSWADWLYADGPTRLKLPLFGRTYLKLARNLVYHRHSWQICYGR